MQRQAMGVALHIVLLPFFELLHSTIDSYDAGLIESAFFCLFSATLTPLIDYYVASASEICEDTRLLNVSP